MDKDKKKELLKGYKEHTVVGGIFVIECSGNGRRQVESTTDMKAQGVDLRFILKIDCAPEPTMTAEYKEYGRDSFSFTLIEEIGKRTHRPRASSPMT